MREVKMGKRLMTLAIGVVALALVAGFAAPSTSSAEPVKFKAVAFLPVNNQDVAGFRIFVDKVNNKFKDYIHIEVLGGPEVTPPFQLHEAVLKGVIDMCATSCAYYPSLLWEAQSAMFTNNSWQERYAAGYDDLMSKLHQKVGLVWLGNGTYDEKFHLYTNKQVSKMADFSGQKIRVFPAFIPFIKALGAVPINLPMGDIYTAMERGAVDGFVMTHYGFVKDFSWNEVTKYVIDYDLYRGTAWILANPKKWGQLPPKVQQEIIEYKRAEVNPLIEDYYNKVSAETWQLLLDKGVKPIRFSDEEGKAFLKLAYDSAWDYIIAKSPELGPKLKKMLVK
jgi:TRAP-type C4-dicarboxylate transport system substrate-binding protein